MIAIIIPLIVSLAVLAIGYILVKWILGMLTLPAPLIQIVNIIFGVIAVVIVLRALLGLL
jgi:hypothetical protein